MSNQTASPEESAPVNLMPSLAVGRDVPLAMLWRSRIEQHHRDSYAGVPMAKFPEDLRAYEQIIWERRPQVIIEIGVQHGGSTLWLRDRVFDFQRYRCGPGPMVLAVDVDLAPALASFADLPPEAIAGIELLEGDVRDDSVVAMICDAVPARAEVLVIDDAAHDATTTLACLRGLAPLIQAGGFYVVEDTCVDIEPLRVRDDWPRGSSIALDDWLAHDALGRRFRRRVDLQPYGLTCHPGGLLQRLPDL